MKWQLKFSKGVKELLCNCNSPYVAQIETTNNNATTSIPFHSYPDVAKKLMA